ncbi:MAG TPA: GNAT family N-acetyltransferase [Chthoniobacterales bacterium]
MDAERSVRFPGGAARLVPLAALRDCAAWQVAFAALAKDHRFYGLVDETLASGFEHHYIVLEDDTGTVRGVQPVFFVRQNLVEGVPAAQRAAEFVRQVFPRFLTMRVLMVGNPAGAGELGLCRAGEEEWVAHALGATLTTFAAQAKASLVVFKDWKNTYRRPMRPLLDADYTRVPSMPMTQLALPYRTFDEYLASLSKATRKDLRRKFRKAEKRPPLELEVLTDVSSLVDELHPLYLQVHERSPMKFETLTKDYLRELGRRMPDRVRFFIWRYEGRIVAFSIALVHDGTIIDDYLGLDYSVALDLHLYFLTFRDIISWSLANGITRYLSSPLNYEPKLHLGCDLLPLDLYVKHTSPVLNALFSRILPLIEPTRHDPVLHRFRNADELL